MPSKKKQHQKDELCAAFARNLSYWREKRGFSRKQLAMEFGVNESTVSLWESGRRFPSCSNLLGLARHFQILPCRLLSTAESPCVLAL